MHLDYDGRVDVWALGCIFFELLGINSQNHFGSRKLFEISNDVIKMMPN